MQHRTVIRFHQLRDTVGYSRSQIDRLEKAGEFPARIQLGKQAVGWYLDEIDKWVKSRPRGFLKNPTSTRRRRVRHRL